MQLSSPQAMASARPWRSPMERTTLHVLTELLDIRATYANSLIEDELAARVNDADVEAERQLRHHLWSAMDKLFDVQPLTEEEIDAAEQALSWNEALDGQAGLDLKRVRTFLEAWNLAGDPSTNAGVAALGAHHLASISPRPTVRRWREGRNGAEAAVESARASLSAEGSRATRETFMMWRDLEELLLLMHDNLKRDNLELAAEGIDVSIELMRELREEVARLG